jgi:hypothetical protein
VTVTGAGGTACLGRIQPSPSRAGMRGVESTGASYRGTRSRRPLQRGNWGQALSLSQACRLPVASDPFENRHHVAGRARPHRCWRKLSHQLTAEQSSDWSSDRSGRPRVAGYFPVARNPPKITVKLFVSLAILSLGATLMIQPVQAAPDPTTDSRIDPQVRILPAGDQQGSQSFLGAPSAEAPRNSDGPSE